MRKSRDWTMSLLVAVLVMLAGAMGLGALAVKDAIDVARSAATSRFEAVQEQSEFNARLIQALRKKFRDHENNTLAAQRQAREAFRPLLVLLAEHVGLTSEEIQEQFEQADQPTGKKGGKGKGNGGEPPPEPDPGPGPPPPAPSPPGPAPIPTPQICLDTIICVPAP